jgi:glyoxylase-like metal-dependent hydrolase (beta-lactamase superfamily II)/8-oxo-dGTP pyrophosphatase MutT (NUDIX family)
VTAADQVRPVVRPRAAATVVLMNHGANGPRVLLTHRPPTMAFAPDVHVFPGGAVDAGDADERLAARSAVAPATAAMALGGDLDAVAAVASYIAAIRELFEEAGVLLAVTPARADAIAAARSALLARSQSFAEVADELDLWLSTDRLVPLSHWVTPPTLPRRFDARFFVAELPEGGAATFQGGEVVAHEWERPGDALRAMADGRMRFWLPTSTTLQQLEHVTSIEDVRRRLAPGRLDELAVEAVGTDVVRIRMPAGGGIAGQPMWSYLVGRERFVLVDPGDPTGPGLDAALARVESDRGTLAAVLLTHVDPDHAAGAEAVAERAGVPVLVGPGGGVPLPYEVTELVDGQPVPGGDLSLRAIATPGLRPDHLAFVLDDGGFAIAGDLDGIRGTRSILGEPDAPTLAASRERLRALVPESRWLGGHPDPQGADPG